MFKKIEIWILYLTILLSILFAIGFGILVRQELVGSTKAGWVSKTALNIAEIPVSLKLIFRNTLKVEDRYPGLDGFHGAPNNEESYLLLSKYNGDLKEGVVELIDLTNFMVLHTWNPDIDAFNKLVYGKHEYKFLDRDNNNSRQLLMHPKLTSDGGLLFGQHLPLNKIDSCSNLLFQNSENKFHHSIETDFENNLWIPSVLYPPSLPIEKIGEELPYYGGFVDDAITKLSQNGEILFEKSVSQIFIDNGLEYLVFGHGNKYEDDPIHLNDIQPVDFDGKYWKKGDVFLSLRSQSMIVLYRPSNNKIIWKGVGPFFHQHDVDILDSHRISIFNNNVKVYKNGRKVVGSNEVVVYDFDTGLYSNYLLDSMKNSEVKTSTSGRGEILPNKDLFIEESAEGRIIFFNTDGSVKWSYVNRSDHGDIFRLGWSRILYTQDEIQTVNNFLNNKGTCNE